MTEKQEFLIAFGNRIRILRTDRQLSLDELARKCGYTSENARSSIQKIEAGKSDIPASKIKLLAQALGVPVSKIMGGYEEDCQCSTEHISKEGDICKQIEAQYGKPASDAFGMYIRLDHDDRSRVIGRMETMLEADKYTSSQEASDEKAI